jgi:soluble lytic murein transglycosylase-like protein
MDAVRVAACRNGIPPDLAMAVVDRESGFNNEAIGPQGEVGAAQILPATAYAYGFDLSRLRLDFSYNVDSGMKILRDLFGRFGGDWTSALRAYNGGPDFSNSSAAAQAQTARYASDVEGWRSHYDSHCP